MSFFTSHSISAEAQRVQSSTLSLDHFSFSFFFTPSYSSFVPSDFLPSTIKHSPYSSFPPFTPFHLTFPSCVIPYASWATAGLSVKVWIIEAYWVWSADGEMAVMDLSVLFMKRWVYADTCPVSAHRSLAEAQGPAGDLGQARPKTAPFWLHLYLCTLTYAGADVPQHTQVAENTNPHVKLEAETQTNKSGLNLFSLCPSYAPAATKEQRDFYKFSSLSFGLCLAPHAFSVPQHFILDNPLLCSFGRLFIPRLPTPLTTTPTCPVSPRLTAHTASVSAATAAPVTPTDIPSP